MGIVKLFIILIIVEVLYSVYALLVIKKRKIFTSRTFQKRHESSEIAYLHCYVCSTENHDAYTSLISMYCYHQHLSYMHH
jgi:hypothetical protein